MKITLETKPLKEMRYPTAGDYFFEEETPPQLDPSRGSWEWVPVYYGYGVPYMPYGAYGMRQKLVYTEGHPSRWKFQVMDLGNDDYEFLIFIHELIEWRLTQKHGVAEEDITAFDKKHLDTNEPGYLKEAPYHKEHMAAEAIERIVATLLGVEWNDYEEAINKKFEELENDTTNQK